MRYAAHNPAPGRRHAAMTYLDMAAAVAVIAIVLGVVARVSDGLVGDSVGQQTSATLRVLDKALQRYYEAHGAWPSGTEPAQIDTPMARCLAALRSSPATASLVTDLPGQAKTPGGWLTVHDGFGVPMVYVHPGEGGEPMTHWARRLPRPPDNRPFVASAGPDGLFGDLGSDDPAQRAASLDNRYSFDPEVSP